MSAPLFILRAVGSKENTVVKAWALEAHQSGASHVGRGEEQGGLWATSWPSTNKHQTGKIVTELPIMEKKMSLYVGEAHQGTFVPHTCSPMEKSNQVPNGSMSAVLLIR